MSAGTDRLMEFLAAEGYRPSLDTDGDILFKFEGGHYLIRLDPADEQYASISFPNFWSIETAEEGTRALRAANCATMLTKVAKVVVVEDQDEVWSEADLFVECPEQLEALLGRALDAIKAGVAKFTALMRASEPLQGERIALRREEVTRFLHGN